MKSFQFILRSIAFLGVISSLLAGCASSQMRARKIERDKVVQTSRLFCDFVNGDLFPDVEVQLNLEIAKRCDKSGTLSITQYRTSNENMGVIYCCSIVAGLTPSGSAGESTKSSAKSAAKSEPAAKSDTKSGDGLGD